MSSHTWACFACRTAARRTAGIANVRCRQCAQPCEWLGTKVPVPPRVDKKAWERLRITYYEFKHRQLQRRQVLKVRRVHDLEQEIARLEALPSNPGRAAAVRTLLKHLAATSA